MQSSGWIKDGSSKLCDPKLTFDPITWSKLTIETLGKGVKYVQS